MSIFIEPSMISPTSKWIDTRFNLFDTEEGFRYYNEGHIPGAVYWDLNKDLSNMQSSEGRHPMPSKKQLQELFERSGLTVTDEIVIYDQGGAPYAARAWFMLLFAGFQNVKIVNGGLQALLNLGYELTDETTNVHRTSLSLEFNNQLLASKELVREIAVGKREGVLIDARSYERYIGEIEPIDPVAGHIPTAVNFNWEQLFEDSRYATSGQLLELFSKENHYIVYCGSGVTAAPLFAALYNEGYEQLQLYVGGYSDWIQHYPVATGDESNK